MKPFAIVFGVVISFLSCNTVSDNSTTKLLSDGFGDTTIISGNTILFLRPDSNKFHTHIKENGEVGIYEADSDFGFGTSATLDSLGRLVKYNNLKSDVTEKRYVLIKDCTGGPLTIDRDSIFYGVILSAPAKEMKLSTMIHSSDYLAEINDYFGIK